MAKNTTDSGWLSKNEKRSIYKKQEKPNILTLRFSYGESCFIKENGFLGIDLDGQTLLHVILLDHNFYTPGTYTKSYEMILMKIDTLLNKGANVDAQYFNHDIYVGDNPVYKLTAPIHMAILFRKMEFIELLVERGANILIQNDHGKNIIDILNYLLETARDDSSKEEYLKKREYLMKKSLEKRHRN